MKNINLKITQVPLVGAAIVLAMLLMLAGPAERAHAACGGTTQVSTESELSSAIAAFNGSGGPCVFTIELIDDIDLTASTGDISNSASGVELTVEGKGHTIDAKGVLNARAFDIQADTTVTIRQITVTGGNTTGSGNTGSVITVRDNATLTLVESTLTGNQGSFGGALTNTMATVTITSSTLNNNQANSGFLPLGGAIWNNSILTVINSTISGNLSDNAGGAIYNSSDGVLTLDSSTISNNEAKDGGGIASSLDTTVTLHNSIIANSVGAIPSPNIRWRVANVEGEWSQAREWHPAPVQIKTGQAKPEAVLMSPGHNGEHEIAL